MINLNLDLKSILTAVPIITTLVLGYLNHNGNQEIDRMSNNLNDKTIYWEAKNGAMVTENTELRFTNKELKQITLEDSTNLSVTKKKLYEANKLIKELDINTKDVENINIVDVEVINDSLLTNIHFNDDGTLESIDPIDTEHLKIEFEINNDSLTVSTISTFKITTVVSRSRDMLTAKKNKRFFIARIINPRWEYTAKNVCDDKNAKITSAISINFQRNKGKR